MYKVAIPSVFHIPAILISGTLYWRTSKTLKTVRSVDRSNLITKTFIALWIFWVITSVPYGIFIAIDAFWLGRSDNDLIDTSFYGVMSTTSLDHIVEDIVSITSKGSYSLAMIRRLWFVEVGLRTLKISYGFINSLLLIILLKPFHQPIVKVCKKFTRNRPE